MIFQSWSSWSGPARAAWHGTISEARTVLAASTTRGGQLFHRLNLSHVLQGEKIEETPRRSDPCRGLEGLLIRASATPAFQGTIPAKPGQKHLQNQQLRPKKEATSLWLMTPDGPEIIIDLQLLKKLITLILKHFYLWSLTQLKSNPRHGFSSSVCNSQPGCMQTRKRNN